MTHYEILKLEDLDLKKELLTDYYQDALRLRDYGCDTGRASIITEEEFADYVSIFVDYDMSYKEFPKDHPKFPGMACARTIRDYFDYSAKVHGFKTYDEFVRWKYEEGPWRPSGLLLYADFKYD